MKSRQLKRNHEDSSETDIPRKKQSLEIFTELEFKLLLRDGSSAFGALERFITESCHWPEESSYDIVAEYCRASPDCSEILQLLEHKGRKPMEIALIMDSLEKILIRIVHDLRKFEAIGLNVVRQLLAKHLPSFYYMLAVRNRSGHIKRALKLLISMVMQSETAAREVQLQFDFQHSVLPPLLTRQDRKDVQDVRTCYLQFMLSFLMAGDNNTIKQLVETKGFLNGMFPGFSTDKFTTLQLVLPTLTEKVVQNPAVTKTSKVRLFNEASLKHLVELYRWKGPSALQLSSGSKKRFKTETSVEIFDESDISEEKHAVQEMVHHLLVELCCSLKNGINFWDKSCATSGKNQNQALTRLLTSLQKPYLHSLQTELVCQILKVCPDQIHWYLPTLKNSLSPRPSLSWTKCMDFLCQIYKTQDEVSVAMATEQSLKVPKMVDIVMNQLFPPKDVWITIVSAVKKENLLVRHYGITVCLCIIKRAAATLCSCSKKKDSLPSDFLQMILDNIVKMLPNLDAVYNCWQAAVKCKDNKQQMEENADGQELPAVFLPDHLLHLLQVLSCYQDALPQLYMEHHIDYRSLLEGVKMARQCIEQQRSGTDSLSMLQLFLLRLLVESDVRQFSWTKENVEGHTALYLLLEMVISTQSDKFINLVVKRLVYKLFVRTGYFTSAENEVFWWINTLTDTHNPLPVIQFLDKAMGCLIRSPYVFLDKIQEAQAQAATFDIENSTFIKEDQNPRTTKALILRILSVEETDLLKDELQMDGGYNGSMVIGIHERKTGQLFSPLVPAALETLHELGSSEPDVTDYVQRVLNTVLHHQVNPGPLCALLLADPCYGMFPRLHSSIVRWNPSSKPKKRHKSPKKPDKKPDDSTDWQTLSELLQANFEQKTELLITSEIMDKTKQIYLNEAGDIMKQILLYLRTAVFEYLTDVTMTTDIIQFYAKLILILTEAVSKSSDAIPTVTQAATEISADFSMLHTEEPSKLDILKDIFATFLHHDIIVNYFLSESDSCSKITEISHVISSLIAETVILMPKSTELSLALKPFSKMVSSYLEKSQQLTSEEVLQTFSGFVELLDTESIGKLLMLLLNSPFMKTLLKHPEKASSVDKHALNILKRLGSDMKVMQHDLPLDALHQLTAAAIPNSNQQLIDILCDIYELAPVYTITIDETMLDHLMHLKPDMSHRPLKLILCCNPYCRVWFVDWLKRTGCLKKRRSRWQAVDQVLYYLNGCTDLSSCHLIYKAYWSELCSWLVDEEDEHFSDDTKFKMLYRIIEISMDANDLISLAQKITDHSLASDLSITRMHYQIIILKLLLQKRLALPNTHGQLETVYLEQSAVHFSIKVLAILLAEKSMKNAETIKLIVNCMLQWTKALKTDETFQVDDTWKNFIMLGLRNLYTSSEYLSALALLLPRIHHSNDVDEDLVVKDIFNLVLSHSQFLQTILSQQQSVVKAALVDLLIALTDIDPGCCQTSHISVLLGAYGASLNETDQKLLSLLHRYEEAGCDLSSYRPFMWGPQSIEYHQLKKNLGPSLCKEPTMEQVIDILDKDKLYNSALKFPLLRTMEKSVQDAAALRSDLDIYDPCFLLPLFSHLLASENLVNCKRFAEHSCLSYVLASLSSHNESLRALAYHTLAKYHGHLEGRTNFHHKYQILYMLNTIKNTIESPNVKLPCIIAIFLAKTAQILLRPEDYMYQIVNAFLLLKPAMDIRHVPEFYMLFNSTAVEYKVERSWMLSLLQDGLKDTQDYHIYERNKIFRLILSFYESAISDQHTQLQILKFLKAACSVRSVASKLLKHHGLLHWLGIAVQTGAADPMKGSHLISIMHTLWCVLLGDRDLPKDNLSTDENHELARLTDGLRDDDEKHPCLPVAVTNQMMLVLVDLLYKLSSPTIETFRRYVDCMLSVCRHAEKTEQMFVHISNIISTHLTQEHMLILIGHWAQLNRDPKLSSITENLLTGKGCLANGIISGCKTQHDLAEENQKENMDKEPKRQCWEILIHLIAYCRPTIKCHAYIARAESCHKLWEDMHSQMLFLVAWSLGELKLCLGSSMSMAQKIIEWFWKLLNHDPDLQKQLLTTDSNILQSFLSMYDHVLSAIALRKDPQMDLDVRNYYQDIRCVQSSLNQIFQRIFQRLSELPQHLQENCPEWLRQRSGMDNYESVLKKMSKLNLSDPCNTQVQNVAMSFVLEFLLGANIPKQTKMLWSDM